MEEYAHWQHLSKHVHDPDDEEKSQRHEVFAQWIVSQLLPCTAEPRRGRVFDVAGGKGHLSHALVEAGVHCVLIDPHAVTGRALHHMHPEEAGEQGDLCGTGCSDDDPVLVFRQTLEQALRASPGLLNDCVAMVGCHPDEATEDIVDTALAHGLPFAVLPCCVYPKKFNQRKTLCGGGVKKHGAFIEYLMEKDPRMRCAHLHFWGRNSVIFMTGFDYQRPRERRRKPDYSPCHLAAKSGNLPLLEELRLTGHPCTTQLCRVAAYRGHIEILKWALLNDCPWSWTVVLEAARDGKREDIVQWAVDAESAIAGQV